MTEISTDETPDAEPIVEADEVSGETDDGRVWHLVAEVLADSQVSTMCGRTVSRDRAVVGDGRMCSQCEATAS